MYYLSIISSDLLESVKLRLIKWPTKPKSAKLYAWLYNSIIFNMTMFHFLHLQE